MANNIHPVMVGTAGHIDHGKSSLVRALSGIDPDRLKEEKERGMTIDLGFAPLALPDGRTMGIVDVPGHERFIKNMVAGSTALDLAILVVAADDGVMPQTREHFDVLQLLGVQRGIVALTKIDLVDEELVELAEQDVRELLSGTNLADVEIVRLSSIKGTNVDEFRSRLQALAMEIEPRDHQGPFRLPIQRVFTLKGVGTVVTGIPVTGAIQVGDTVEFLPGGHKSKVRALQAYGGQVERSVAGHSTALSVPDVKKSEVHRGFVAALPGMFRAGDTVDVELTILPHGEGLAHREPVRFHTGTSESKGLLILLDREQLSPGEQAVARVLLDEPVCCVYGDRFLLRLQNPVRTVGGGRCLRLHEASQRYRRQHLGDELQRLVVAGPSPQKRILEELERAGPLGRTPAELAGGLGLPQPVVEEQMEGLEGAHRHERENRFFLRDQIEFGRDHVQQSVERILKSKPLAASIQRSQLRTSREMPEPLLAAVLADLQVTGEVRSSTQGRLIFVNRLKPLGSSDQAALDRLVSACEERGFKPLALAELPAAVAMSQKDVDSLFARAMDEGLAVQVDTHVYGAKVMDRLLVEIYRNCRAHGEELHIPELRDELQTTRKFLIPLLEYVDQMGLTRLRAGVRILLKTSAAYEQIADRMGATE